MKNNGFFFFEKAFCFKIYESDADGKIGHHCLFAQKMFAYCISISVYIYVKTISKYI